jgi:hypothetical protein
MRQAFGDYDDRTDDFELVGDEREADYPSPSDRRVPTIALTMLVMALFAGGLWFAYHLGARHAPGGGGAGVPLIRADRTPDKVKPAEPGGMKIPDQNVSLYNEKPGISSIETLLPPPEKPLPRPAPPPAIAAPPPAIAAPPPVEPRPAVAPREVVTPRPAVAPHKAAAPPAAPQQAGFGRIEVRLATVRTPDEARVEWARLKRDNADLLGRLHAFAVRSEQGDRGIYRIEAGPFADVAAAERLCSELRQRHRGCVVGR